MADIRQTHFPPSRERELLDLARVADATGMVGYCPGGRAILSDYICIHCRHDTSVDRKWCGAPVGSDGISIVKPKRARPA